MSFCRWTSICLEDSNVLVNLYWDMLSEESYMRKMFDGSLYKDLDKLGAVYSEAYIYQSGDDTYVCSWNDGEDFESGLEGMIEHLKEAKAKGRKFPKHVIEDLTEEMEAE